MHKELFQNVKSPSKGSRNQARKQPVSWADMFGLYRFNIKRGLFSILSGLGYFKCIEYAMVFNSLKLKKGLRLLDIGSDNSIFPLFIGSKGCEVWATDIDHRVLKLRHGASKLGINDFHAEIQDATSLRYSDNFFDRVSAISTLEHIPNDGDSEAMKEIHRVMKEGGIAVVTVPYGHFEKEREKIIGHFQRVYNEKTVYQRLIDVSSLNLKKVEYFGETRYHFTKCWWRMPLVIQAPLMWMQPLFAKLFLCKIDQKDIENLSSKEKSAFMMTAGVCLTLGKTNRPRQSH